MIACFKPNGGSPVALDRAYSHGKTEGMGGVRQPSAARRPDCTAQAWRPDDWRRNFPAGMMHNAMILRLSLLLSSIALALSGCTRSDTRYAIRVTTYLSHALPFPTPRADIRIAVVAKTEPSEPLLEVEVTKKIERLVTEHGYSIGTIDDSAYILSAFFAIDDGTTAIGSYPVYRPGGTATTNIYTGSGRWAVATTRLPGSTSYRSYSYTYYTRYIGLTLYERKRWLEAGEKDLAETIAWRATTTSSGSSSDLRQVIDYLLVATFDYFGEDTGKQVHRSLKKDNEAVNALRMP